MSFPNLNNECSLKRTYFIAVGFTDSCADIGLTRTRVSYKSVVGTSPVFREFMKVYDTHTGTFLYDRHWFTDCLYHVYSLTMNTATGVSQG